MATLIGSPVLFQDAAVRGEEIKEYVGRISTGNDEVSIGLLTFPEGWSEPPQTPEFDEYTVVLEGALYVDTESAGTVIVRKDQAILTLRGERIRYRTPEPGGSRYVSICLPAFTPERAHREPEGSTIPATDKPVWGVNSRAVVLVQYPSILQSTGRYAKQVKEFFGILSNNSTAMSAGRILSGFGCEDDFHKVSYDKCYIILNGELSLEVRDGEKYRVCPGEALWVPRDETTKFGTPFSGGAEYIVVCLPARDLDFDCRRLRTDIHALDLNDSSD